MLAHGRVEPFGERTHEVAERSHVERLPDFLLGRVGRAVGHVAADRVVEEPHVLRNRRNIGAKRVKRVFLRVDAVDQDAARGWIPEARDHVHERALARTRKTNEGDAFARPDGEREVVDRVPLRSGVAERNMFEDEFAAAVPELDRALVRLIRLVEQAEDAFGRNAHLRKARVDAREVAKRRHQQKKRGEEGDEVTHRQEPEARLVHGEGQHDGDARHADHLRERRSERGDLRHFEQHPAHRVVDAVEAPEFVFVGVGELDEPVAVVHLFDAAQHFGEGLLTVLHQHLDAGRDESQKLDDQGREQEAHEGEHPVVPEKHAHERDHLAGVAHENDARLGCARKRHV